jgi:hypothetical protein
MSDGSSEVPVEAAYQAANTRLQRTVNALILAEAQVLTLTDQVRRLDVQCGDQAAEIRALHRRLEEVTQDGETEQEPAADSETGATHPFSD